MILRLLSVMLTFPVTGLCQLSSDFVDVNVDEFILRRGENKVVSISVEVMEGYHIQAHEVDDESLVPATLEVTMDEDIAVTRINFPPGKKFKLEGTDTFLQVYDGTFTINIFLEARANARRGNHNIAAKLRYQACDSTRCFFPRELEFVVPLRVDDR